MLNAAVPVTWSCNEPDLIASILRTLCADILADHGTGASSGLGEGHLGWDDVNGVIRTVF